MKRDASADRDDLYGRLMVALGDMVEMTCPSMRPLWLHLSQSARAAIVGKPEEMPSLPAHLLTRPPARSKYEALAGWRHAVVWQGILESGEGAASPSHAAMRRIYFQPCPNVPPFSYSSAAGALPDLGPKEVPSCVKDRAKRGCWRAVEALFALFREAEALGDDDIAAFIRLGFRGSLKDVLKLEGHWDRPLDPDAA